MGGAEPTVLAIAKLFPDAPIYTSVYDKKNMPAFSHLKVRTTWLQKIPGRIKFKHILFPVLRAFAFRSLDLSEFDIVISSSSAEAKAIKTRKDAVHMCYCHTPTRYYWSHYQEFKQEFQFGALTFLIRPFIPLFVRWMRKKDYEAAQQVDVWIANSNVTKERIKKYYNANAVVIHPPVTTKKFIRNNNETREGYIVWGRHVPYKRFDLAIEACNAMRKKLVVVGNGPDTPRLKSIAGPTILFPGRVGDDELVRLAHRAEAFLFPNEEDFGIAAVEALAAGLPVIAYKKGGALDIIKDGETGIFFTQHTAPALQAAMEKSSQTHFSYNTLVQRSKRFDEKLFETKIKKCISDAVQSSQSISHP
jgi:glycosyltransferase involved in cell wall biosynthesis